MAPVLCVDQEDLSKCTFCHGLIDLATISSAHVSYAGAVEKLHFCTFLCMLRWIKQDNMANVVALTLPVLDVFDIEDLQASLSTSVQVAA